MVSLELLAPARNLSTGIAAIDCGADAVYMAGPLFGARHNASNSLEDLSLLCSYAHRFGVRIYATVNTILGDDETDSAREMLSALSGCGVDALIVQDPAVLVLSRSMGLDLPMHASTQCAIRDPEKARFLEKLGFSRLVLERQLSLEEIGRIRSEVRGELEFFVHGALCMSYSGQCYLSEYLAGRSANRGECVQACRSLYDLVDEEGNVLLSNKAVLSLKDLNLSSRLEDLSGAGICSFKIEGRLKNESYVRNVVREYSLLLDSLVGKNPDKWTRSSYGRVVKGFTPDPDKTFNRGYTSLYMDGRRGRWASMDTPRSVGERIGRITKVTPLGRGEVEIRFCPDEGRKVVLSNGDGFSVVSSEGITGFRGDVCQGQMIRTRAGGIPKGAVLYRNTSVAFEKILSSNPGKRLLSVVLDMSITKGPEGSYRIRTRSLREDGTSLEHSFTLSSDPARDSERMMGIIRFQISKESGRNLFTLGSLDVEGALPMISTAFLNSMRRQIGVCFDEIPCRMAPLRNAQPESPSIPSSWDGRVTYKENVANTLARTLYEEAGASEVEPAYELSHRDGAELMRSRYCLRWELGICLKGKDGGSSVKSRPGRLFLVNNGKKIPLSFDCSKCEMIVGR